MKFKDERVKWYAGASGWMNVENPSFLISKHVLRERKQTWASAGAGAQESKIRICKQGPPRCLQIQMSISHRKSEKILLNPPSLSKPNSPKNAFVYNSSFYLIFADQAVIILMWHAITRVRPMWHVTVIRSFERRFAKISQSMRILKTALLALFLKPSIGYDLWAGHNSPKVGK